GVEQRLSVPGRPLIRVYRGERHGFGRGQHVATGLEDVDCLRLDWWRCCGSRRRLLGSCLSAGGGTDRDQYYCISSVETVHFGPPLQYPVSPRRTAKPPCA